MSLDFRIDFALFFFFLFNEEWEDVTKSQRNKYVKSNLNKLIFILNIIFIFTLIKLILRYTCNISKNNYDSYFFKNIMFECNLLI